MVSRPQVGATGAVKGDGVGGSRRVDGLAPCVERAERHAQQGQAMTEPSGDEPRTRVLVEVTDTLSIDFTTGIQRVVREVVAGLSDSDVFEVVPVVTPAVGAGFRTLTADETDRLSTHPAGGRAGRRADDFGPLGPVVRRIGDLPITVKVRGAVATRLRSRGEILPAHDDLGIGPLPGPGAPTGSVFLDVEGSWYDPTPRAELLPRLRDAGIRRAVLVHDVMPVLYPEWFTEKHIRVFTDWLIAHLTTSELFLTNSRRTANDLRSAATALGIGPDLDIRPVPLGADYLVDEPEPVEELVDGRLYVLVVGTLEPRKNQGVVLDAMERLWDQGSELDLVLVGKEGWLVDRLVQRLRRHPRRGGQLHWLGGVDDRQLAWLYDNAFVTVAPSIYEGLGVPVLEALGHGCATISSNGGAQPEAAGDAAEFFEPTDVAALTGLLRLHLEDPGHHERQRAAAAEFTMPTWAQTTDAVVAALTDLVSG